MNHKVDDIAEAMRADVPPWRMPWVPDGGFPTNAYSNQRYSGLNPLLLNLASMRRGFTSKYWATYKQWGWVGCKVKSRPDDIPEGQWATMIARPTGPQYPVFNGDQVYGRSADKWKTKLVGVVRPDQIRYDRVDKIIEECGATIKWGNYKFPRYMLPPDDFIAMPWKKRFTNVRELYATQFHQLMRRMLSKLDMLSAGFEGWLAYEELVVEIGQCYLESELNLPHWEDLTHYHRHLSTWLQAISEDSSFIYAAAEQAEKSVDMILYLGTLHRHSGA